MSKKQLIYYTLSLLGFCPQSLRKSEKWTDIVKSLLQWLSQDFLVKTGIAPAMITRRGISWNER